VNQATRQDLAKKAKIPGNALPYFQVDDKTILTDSTAIAKYLIRNSDRAETLLGSSSPFLEA
jgi:glutathione S-transferase